MIYSYAKLSKYDLGLIRLLGPGLGNLLFPWARSIIANQQHGLTSIPTTWPQLKVGSILRNENDKRAYFDLFNSPDNNFPLARKLRLLYFAKHISEEQFRQSGIPGDNTASDLVVLFSGTGNGFADLAGYSTLVLDALTGMAKDKHLSGYRENLSDGICMHIRLGDFVTGGHGTTPIDWYVSAATKTRQVIGENIPIYIFSDGTRKELSPLLNLGNAEITSYGSSVADILAMINTRILIATARSTFSGWASYLGNGLTIWPEDSIKHGLLETENNTLELGSDSDIPKQIEKIIQAIWTN